MKKYLLPAMVILAVGLFAWSARTEAPEKGEKGLKWFNHDRHYERFAASNYDCNNCHINEKNMKERKVRCHDCHHPWSHRPKAISECSLCHENVEALKTKEHTICSRSDWMTTHQRFAKSDSKMCNDCHKPKFCIRCHEQTGDTIKQTMHRRNYKFYHSVEARTNPRKCDSCHRVTYCNRCHQNPR